LEFRFLWPPPHPLLPAAAAAGKLAVVVARLLHMERVLFGLLDGAWAGEGAGGGAGTGAEGGAGTVAGEDGVHVGVHSGQSLRARGACEWRAAWHSKVRGAISAADLSPRLLELEAALRPSALRSAWWGPAPSHQPYLPCAITPGNVTPPSPG